METTTIILIIFAAIIILGLFFLILKVSNLKSDTSSEKIISILQNQITELIRKQDETNRDINIRLREQSESLNKQLNQTQQTSVQQFAISQKSLKESTEASNKIIRDVTEKLTKLDETNKQVVNFAGQLQSLENILKNPKQRGILGEYFLESVLKNVLPPNAYQMQYRLGKDEKTGKDLIVDAAIFVKDKIIPVDAKFSLENYNKIVVEQNPEEREKLEKIFKQDLIKRIEETSKYIRPEKNTMDFAFMFIPSEGIYYDILVNKGGNVKIDTEKLIEEAFKLKVLIVSPTNFLAYLQTVLQGLRALKIEESALQIKENVIKLTKHLQIFSESFDKIGKNISTTVNSYNTSYKSFKQIDKDIFKITDEKLVIEADEVLRPLDDEITL